MAERLTVRDENGEAYVPIENHKPPYPLVTDDAVEKLARLEDLEEQGRLIELPEGMNLRKLLDVFTEYASDCPSDYNLSNRCELSCFECWLAALKGKSNEEIDR